MVSRMINYSEIKNDIKNGYGYMEYERKCYKGQLTIVWEHRPENVIFRFVRDNYETSFSFTAIEFLTMKYNEITKRFVENIYYNMYQIDEYAQL